MDHNISKLLGKPTLEGQVGESHVWDGPLDTSGFPMGKGSSSGITGMQVKKYPCKSKCGTLVSCACNGVIRKIKSINIVV